MTEEKAEAKTDEDNKETEKDRLEGLFDFTSQRTDELINKYYEQANNKVSKGIKLQVHEVLKMIGDDKDATEQEKIVVCFMMGRNTAKDKHFCEDNKTDEGETDAEKSAD